MASPDVHAIQTWASFAFRSWTTPSPAEPPPDVPFDAPLLRSLGIWPFVYQALRASGDDRAREFARDYRHATTANLIRLTRGARIAAALNDRGITAVVLKGGAFALRFCHETPGLRPMGDLDLLVSREDYPEAAALLVDCGFVPASSEVRASRRTAHAGSFIDSGGAMPLDIDLHDALAPWPIATALTRRILARHDRSGPWRLPALPHAFCLTALHRARHAFRWSALDLFELKHTAVLLDDAGWADVLETSREAHMTGAVWAAYRQAVWWLGGDDGDERRLADLSARLGRVRHGLLARIAAPERVVMPDPRWERPFARNFIVAPLATTTPARALIAASRVLPLRAIDEWRASEAQRLGLIGRVRWLCRRAVRGSGVAGQTAKRVP